MSIYQSDSWVQSSKALLDDGVIYYSAPKGKYRKQFKRLERQLGIDFERVKDPWDAEIVCRYKELSGGRAGLAQQSPGNRFYVSTDPYYKGRMVEAHEIGHVLGLGHCDHERSLMNTDVAWGLNKNFLTKFDRQNIADLLL